MEKYSSAVSEMYSQFKKGEPYPLEKYIGRLVSLHGRKVEVVGYSLGAMWGRCLIADASLLGGWDCLDVEDVVLKECDAYCYASINDLID